MLLAADALHHFSIAGLMSVEGRTDEMTLADLLTRARRTGYDLDWNDEKGTLLIDFRESAIVTRAVAADSCRLASASFQTIARTSEELVDREKLPWSLVKLYYAAFYAGHAVLRICGESCSYFNRGHVDRMDAVFSAIGARPSFRVDAGLYHCVVNPSATGMECHQARGSVGGGHESFWKIFAIWVGKIGEALLKGPLTASEAQEVFGKLQELQRIIGGNGPRPHGWLSSMRNELQYRLQFGVWLPSKMRKRDREFLARLAEQWKRDPMDVDLQLGNATILGQFVVACAFVVSLCRVMLVRIGERSAVGRRSFVYFGPLALLATV